MYIQYKYPIASFIHGTFKQLDSLFTANSNQRISSWQREPQVVESVDVEDGLEAAAAAVEEVESSSAVEAASFLVQVDTSAAAAAAVVVTSCIAVGEADWPPLRTC